MSTGGLVFHNAFFLLVCLKWLHGVDDKAKTICGNKQSQIHINRPNHGNHFYPNIIIIIISMANRVIVIGGGLAGLTTAHSILEHGGSVTLIDKSAFMGGNSTKATSGINGTPTQAQADKKVHDSARQFMEDTNLSYHGGKKGGAVSPIVLEMARLSGPSLDWLSHNFNIDLSILGLMAGHTAARTHRGKEKFPGMTITYGLMSALEQEAKKNPERVKIFCKSRAVRLIRDGIGPVVGVVYADANGVEHDLRGPVVIATGGYAADYSGSSLLQKYTPQLMQFATTNGAFATGDGVKMGEAIGAGLIDMDKVQVHPTGLVDPKDPTAKTKFLAAEALRGTGAIMLNKDGKRFANELARRKDLSEAMMADKGPFRLVLNSKCAAEMLWHCKHYAGRGLMIHYKNGEALAKGMGVVTATLADTFSAYTKACEEGKDSFGKPFFRNGPWSMEDSFYVAVIEPVVHYSMGGLHVNEKAEVLAAANNGKTAPPPPPVPGLWCAGECAGGVHGINRLGGNSLLDCVVFGRVAGQQACKYLLRNVASTRLNVLASQLGGADAVPSTVVANPPAAPAAASSTAKQTAAGPHFVVPKIVVPQIPGYKLAAPRTAAAAAPSAVAMAAAAPTAPAAGGKTPKPVAGQPLKKLTRAEVAKHNSENDCWVIVGKQVLDCTHFLDDHPGGGKSILQFAGKDSTEEFDMLHKREVIQKYAPETVIGELTD